MSDPFARITERVIADFSKEIAGISLGLNDRTLANEDLKDIDCSIDMMENAALDLQAFFVAQLAHVRRLRNATRPINRLPNEVFVLILYTFVAGSPNDQYDEEVTFVKRRNRIQGVSSGWQNCVARNPKFWAVCSPYLPKWLLEKSLTKSGTHGLRILYRERGTAEVTGTRQRTFMTTMTPHFARCHRIRSVAFELLMDSINSGSMKALEVLELERGHKPTGPETRARPFLYEGLNVSRLSVVRLNMISMPWTLPRFSELTILELSFISQLPTSVLVEILRTNPRLEELRLRNFEFDTRNRAPEELKIQLPRLQILELAESVPETLRWFLTLLDPGLLRKLSIRTSFPNRLTLDYTTLPAYISESVLYISGFGTPLEIQVNYGEISLISHNTDDIYLGGLSDISLKWWIQLLASSANIFPSRLCFNSGRSQWRLPAVLSIADSHQSIEHVTLCSSTSIRPFVDFICSPAGSIDHKLPKLSSIALYEISSEQLEDIRAPLQRRYGSSSKFAPLLSLTYRGYKPIPEVLCMIRGMGCLNACKVFREAPWKGKRMLEG